jgi:hypothetical protein
MKFTNHPLMTVLASLGWLAAASAAADQTVDLRGGFGYDTNPFELNDSIGTREGMFADAEAQVSAEGQASKGWRKRADIGASGRLFESGMTDGNEARYYVRARGDSNEQPTEHGWEWSLRYQLRDKTYVSRFTGLVATEALGNKIGGRYDSTAADLMAAWHFPRKAFGRISVEGSIGHKDYLHDYEQFGLERLDYIQYGITPRYEIGDRDNRLRFSLQLEERKYDDRRVSDAAGVAVPGTDLEYRYYGFEARYTFKLSRRASLDWRGGFELRRDNGVGFADRTQWNTGIEWSWRARDKSSLSLQVQYSSRKFDQQVVGDPTVNDEVPEKKGFDVAVSYARPFPFLDIRDLSLVAEAGWESFDNSKDIRYAYDRVAGLVAVRKEF